MGLQSLFALLNGTALVGLLLLACMCLMYQCLTKCGVQGPSKLNICVYDSLFYWAVQNPAAKKTRKFSPRFVFIQHTKHRRNEGEILDVKGGIKEKVGEDKKKRKYHKECMKDPHFKKEVAIHSNLRNVSCPTRSTLMEDSCLYGHRSPMRDG